jgi:phthiocerol/phenolphthiocerol synthesis type-I polyketide synthase C
MRIEKIHDDPIAIVGMAFRFPGDASDEQSFWQALKEGRDLVTQVDAARWAVDELQHPNRSEPGRSVTFSAGVLSRIEEFDAAFFGISPREAACIDPQQRLLLELAWEAMENAGQVPSRLAASDVAVYVGISSMDYGLGALDDLASMTAHSMTGNTLSIAANRLSYVFDLRGPSLAVDTACSSSLVALHHACSSLRSGEASAALVGGVSLLLHPYPFVGFTKASMLSATGRCRAFDASGDGYVRAEGGAVLFLKPLSRALADGDTIQAVIRATGVNSDGGQKTGMTIPSRDGQAELMQSVLQRTGIPAHEVDYIEAHGTGTPVGDPIEAAAIGAVYGRLRPRSRPLPIGSVKTNLGHLEPASGMPGLVKTVLALKHRALPPSLHFETPNPHIDFKELNLEVVTGFRPLEPAAERPLVAGVNSFGFGGTNAHVLLEEYRPGNHPERTRALPAPPLFLSAPTSQALRATAARYAEYLKQNADADYYDVAHAAAFKRQRFEKRLALSMAEGDDAAARLMRFAQGEDIPQAVLEDGLAQPGGIAFIYSGNGAQWVGMGRRLIAESPSFAEALAALDARMAPVAGFSILQELNADASASRLDNATVAQSILFAIQVALTTLLREHGIEAAAVAGHSAGEVAAAWAAGILDLDQAIKIICARSVAQALTHGSGRMAAVALGEPAMRKILAAGEYDDVEIAGINSPNSITLSGSLADLKRLRGALAAQRVPLVLLDLEYAFHSRHMDAIEDTLAASLANLAPRSSAGITFVSTVTGDALEGGGMGADYWWRNVRQPVRFAEAVSTLVARGCRVFVEIGPHAILQRYVKECLNAEGIQGRMLDTLRRNDDGLSRIEETALRIHLLSEPARLGVYFPEPGRRVTLPNYPWQRERHTRPKTNEDYALVERRRVHPLLGWRLKEMDAAWENTLDPATLDWLADHQVGGAIVLPGAAYVEMALAAAREWFGKDRFELEQLDIIAPVVFDADHARTLRFEFSPRDGAFHIRSRQRLSEDDWSLNAAGRILGAPAAAAEAQDLSIEPPGEASVVDRETHYRLTAAIGLEYGPAFQGLEAAHVQGKTLHASVIPPDSVNGGGDRQYLLHPAVLDVCFQSLADFFKEEIEAGHGVPLLPVKVGSVRYFNQAPVATFRARLLRRGARSVAADFELLDAAGHIIAILSGCRFRAAVLHRQGAAAPARWRIEPEVLPHPADALHADFPATGELSRHVRTWFADQEARLERTAYFKEALPLFEALSVSFAYEAFEQLFSSRGEWLQRLLTNAGAVHGEGIPLPFIRWLSGCLRYEGLLIERDGVWRLGTTDIPSAEDIWNTILRDFPSCLPELVLAGRVGRNLPGLLTGETAGEAFLNSLRNSHPSETLYNDSPAYLGDRLATEQILRTLAQDIPAHRRLRILEVSVGASELPRQLAGLLPDDRLDYILAESDDEARDRLAAEFQNHPFVTVAGLANEELELVAENDLPDVFDVIILRHWLHRARNPVAALIAARRKLALGGVLILAERHSDLGANFVHGLDPLWWHDAEGEEPMSCLLSPTAWIKALEDQGFEDIETLFEPASEELSEGSYLLLAKRPQEQIARAESAVATWLLLSDAQGPSVQLSGFLLQHLESRGQRVAVALADGGESGALPAYAPEDPESVSRLLRAARDQLGNLDHVVHLAGWQGSDALADGSAPPESDACIGLLHLVRALAGGTKFPRLWLLTSGGALASNISGRNGIDPAQASLWGFGRVIMNEYPALACTLIDVACDPASPETAQRLENELLLPDQQCEIILAPEARYSLRMRRDNAPEESPENGGASRFRLDFQAPGQLRNLVWLPNPERPLNEDEIEVRAMAAGLNFRDVMYTMGLLPDEAVESGFAGASIGLEFAGIVTRTGERVREYAPGDAVMGFGPACFASHVVTKANALALKPAEWSFEEAATVPTVFFTVYYALKHLADLQPGERVLIHGAAGGVGIAAIQVASHLGAEIFATAGSDEKRDFVRLLGADHVFDSRSLDFGNQILALTGGEGVDVVLNSLAGEAIRRNLRLLKPFGRFLELGKRDFFENTPIGLRPFKDNISYFGIDADQLLVARPELAARLFREVMTLFREGVLSPLPYRVFPAGRVVDAFRTMQQSRHIGKVVVTLDGAQVKLKHAERAAALLQFEKDATWLITGGLSGFGLESARWLAERGAGNLVLLGRRGIQTPGAAEAIVEFEAMGVCARAIACDVADRAALQSVIADIQREMPPLKGVLHAAMVLDDALIASLDAERFRAVLVPKLLGAKHLHELTLDIPIDHFILYSSVTTFIGNPGQANYVAANAYLEGLANLRRSLGLPVACIGWGPIGDAGYLTRNEAVKDSLKARLGAAPLAASSALAMLGTLMARDTGNLAVADFGWHTLARLLPSAGASRFERLRREAGKAAAGDEHDMDFAGLILGKSPEEVHEIVQTLVTQEVAKILGIGADRIDPARSLNDLGMDSLMGIELALGLEERFDIRLPAMMLNEGPTVERVTARIVEKAIKGHGEDEASEGGDLTAYVNAMAAQHGETPSAEEVTQVVDEIRDNLKTARGQY